MDTYEKHNKRVRARVRRMVTRLRRNTGPIDSITLFDGAQEHFIARGTMFGNYVDGSSGENAEKTFTAIERLLESESLVEIEVSDEQLPSFVDRKIPFLRHLLKYTVIGFPSEVDAAKFRMLNPEIKFLPMKPD